MEQLTQENDDMKRRNMATEFRCETLESNIKELKEKRLLHKQEVKDLEKRYQAALNEKHTQLANELEMKIAQSNKALRNTEEQLNKSQEELKSLKTEVDELRYGLEEEKKRWKPCPIQ